MKQVHLTFLLLFISSILFSQSRTSKTFIGAEKFCMSTNKNDSCDNSDKELPKWKWYHFNVLRIKADSVTLYERAGRIYKKDTSFPENNTGFYKYQGTMSKLTDSTFLIMLTETCCDYCGKLFETQNDGTEKRIFQTIIYSCKRAKGGFWANNIFYKRTIKIPNILNGFSTCF